MARLLIEERYTWPVRTVLQGGGSLRATSYQIPLKSVFFLGKNLYRTWNSPRLRGSNGVPERHLSVFDISGLGAKGRLSFLYPAQSPVGCVNVVHGLLQILATLLLQAVNASNGDVKKPRLHPGLKQWAMA
jgi:hypothetical protein